MKLTKQIFFKAEVTENQTKEVNIKQNIWNDYEKYTMISVAMKLVRVSTKE